VYTTEALVIAEFKNLDVQSSGTMLVTSQLEEWIDQECAIINGAIGGRYETPIIEANNPQAFLILRRIATAMVAKRVRAFLATKTASTPSATEANPSSAGYDPRKDLEKIRNQELYLLDATQRGVLIRPNTAPETQWVANEDQW